MRLFLARIFPPLAVLLCWKPFSAFFNCFLTIFGWYPGVAHAVDVVNNHLADKRNTKSMHAINQPAWATRVFPEQSKTKYKRLTAAKTVEPNIIDNPKIGAGGTRFRSKS